MFLENDIICFKNFIEKYMGEEQKKRKIFQDVNSFT